MLSRFPVLALDSRLALNFKMLKKCLEFFSENEKKAVEKVGKLASASQTSEGRLKLDGN